MRDRQKLQDWLNACPVAVTGIEPFAFGTFEIRIELQDEKFESIEEYRLTEINLGDPEELI